MADRLMCNILIVVTRDNSDRNSLEEIAAAVGEAGAHIDAIDEPNHVIEATLPATEIATVAAMEGVKFVRCVMTYVAKIPEDEPSVPAA